MDTLNRSLSRGLQILRIFNTHPTPTLGEVAEASGLPKPTVFRFMKTLAAEGYVTVREPSKRYHLTPAVLELGYAALRSLGVGATLTPFLEELAAKTGGVANLSVLDGRDILYLARVAPPPEIRRLVTMRISVGSRIPAHCTAMGRILLAISETALDTVLAAPLTQLTPKTTTSPEALERAVERARRAGYSLVEEELALGFNGAAVPVVTSKFSGLALGLTVQTTDYTRAEITADLVPLLRETAERVSSALSMSD